MVIWLKQAKIDIWKLSPKKHVSFTKTFLRRNIVSPPQANICARTLYDLPGTLFFLTPTPPPPFLKFGTEGCPPAEGGERGVDTVSSFGKVVGWLYFEDEPKVQAKRQVKNQQSHIPISVGYPTCSRSN